MLSRVLVSGSSWVECVDQRRVGCVVVGEGGAVCSQKALASRLRGRCLWRDDPGAVSGELSSPTGGVGRGVAALRASRRRDGPVAAGCGKRDVEGRAHPSPGSGVQSAKGLGSPGGGWDERRRGPRRPAGARVGRQSTPRLLSQGPGLRPLGEPGSAWRAPPARRLAEGGEGVGRGVSGDAASGPRRPEPGRVRTDSGSRKCGARRRAPRTASTAPALRSPACIRWGRLRRSRAGAGASVDVTASGRVGVVADNSPWRTLRVGAGREQRIRLSDGG